MLGVRPPMVNLVNALGSSKSNNPHTKKPAAAGGGGDSTGYSRHDETPPAAADMGYSRHDETGVVSATNYAWAACGDINYGWIPPMLPQYPYGYAAQWLIEPIGTTMFEYRIYEDVRLNTNIKQISIQS